MDTIEGAMIGNKSSVLQIYSELQIAGGDGEQHVDITQLNGNGKVDSNTAGAGAQSALPFERLGMSFSHGECIEHALHIYI